MQLTPLCPRLIAERLLADLQSELSRLSELAIENFREPERLPESRVCMGAEVGLTSAGGAELLVLEIGLKKFTITVRELK